MRKFKRYMAFIMSVVTLSSFLGEGAAAAGYPSLITGLAASATTTNTPVVLSYLKSDDGVEGTATIIAGNSTTIRVDKKLSGYTEANPPFIVKADQALPSGSQAKDFIEIQGSSIEKTRQVVSRSMPTGLSEITYSIMGEYYVLNAEGYAYETAMKQPDGQPLGTIRTTVTSLSPNAVMNYSEATIVCTVAETKDGSPVFSFTGPQTGVFAEFPAEKSDWTVVSRTTDVNKPKELRLEVRNKETGATKEFRIQPQQIHEYPDTAPGAPIGAVIRNNYITKDTKFHLVFTLPTSNELFLRVLTPNRALENIAAEINRNNGEDQNTYIQLAKGDSLNFITQPFNLRSRINQYNSYFDIEWKWEPANTEDSTVVSIAGSGSNGWKNVAINPKPHDITGKLTAVVYYKTGQNDEVNTGAGAKGINLEISRNILVRGTGDPAATRQIRETVGLVPKDFAPNAQTPPSAKDMDVYDGSVVGYKAPTAPYKYQLALDMGKRNASSQYAIVKVRSGDGAVISAQTITPDGKVSDYKWGDQIKNPLQNVEDQLGTILLDITARKKGTVTLEFEFYVKGNNNQIVKAAVQPAPITIQVYDTSPNNDSSLKTLVLKDQNNKIINYSFSPSQLQYDIEVPYATESISLTPTRNNMLASENIKVTYFELVGNVLTSTTVTPKSGFPTNQINLRSNQANTIEVTVTSQNPQIMSTYILNIMRLPPSDDSSLKTLALFDASGKNVLTNFKPGVFEYAVTVPYKTSALRVVAETNHPGATDPMFDPELKPNGSLSKPEWLHLIYEKEPFNDVTTLKVTVESEIARVRSPQDTGPTFPPSVYTVRVTRGAPSNIATLSELKVTDAAGKVLSYTPTFNKDLNLYTLSIPYSTKQIKVSANTTDTGATMSLQNRDGQEIQPLTPQTASKGVDIQPATTAVPFDEVSVLVTAEDGVAVMRYRIQVERAEASKDAELSKLTAADQDGKNVELDFHPEVYGYNVIVPYETTKIRFTPTSANADSVIKINDRVIKSGSTTTDIRLEYPAPTLVTVLVTAEDGVTTKTYTLNITRKAPSNDARLKGLTVSGIAEKSFKPVFISNTVRYTATVEDGAKGVKITPTANHVAATILIDGKRVESGKASDQIDLIEVKQNIDIVVTAQDGITKIIYTIVFTNPNLVTKTSNADLEDLIINYGAMTPSFKSSTTSYEVAASEETYSVEIIPQPADSLATVTVYAGTKQIGDYYGNYSQAIADGENNFTVKVVSPDKTQTKEYSITVYRNEEDKLNVLKPITPEDIDYEKSNPIVVDISKYTRVSAEVFNELQKHKDKKILFQGNDYSLEFNASDFKTQIPHTTIYDFGLSFTSPLEDEIMDEIDSYSGNAYAELVFVYFKHHGELPAKATFTLSLGREYQSETLYWHYYNEERKRIDYYGYFTTNSRGTFTIPLEHMSTYIIADQRLAGSENKTPTSGANLSKSSSSGGKINPNTGTAGGRWA